MASNLNKFIRQLQAYQSTQNVFNPWRDYDEIYDICSEAPNIRLKQMEQFLCFRLPYARYLLVAEAIGYMGGKFTGIALTSERILLGKHNDIKPNVILQNVLGVRTSNPNNNQLNDTQKDLGFTESTATIVWKEIMRNNVSPFEIITWNIFPFHPFDPSKGSLSNRTPVDLELEVGTYYTKMLLKLCPDVTVVSIGRHSERKLNELGIQNIHVPHPANGGACRFRAAIGSVLA